MKGYIYDTSSVIFKYWIVFFFHSYIIPVNLKGLKNSFPAGLVLILNPLTLWLLRSYLINHIHHK